MRESANRLGDLLCRDALAWAKTIALSVAPATASEEELFEEVLAYAISLAGLRLSGLETADAKRFLRLLRERTGLVKAGIKWRRAARRRQLAAPGRCGVGRSSVSRQQAARLPHGRITKEMFEHFQSATGLSSNVLVGKGENLASLVFYISVHAVLSVEESLIRANTLVMLRACRQCRAHFERTLGPHLQSNKQPSPQLGPGR